ncbi:MAG TPA: SDR family NAD(P)-dependent oxidoreductase [Dehalococcoidales bacterium]|nr:SDR family NAD(P)-dependent oxidoreductase [Dehalococcoidales bacterium]
MKLSDRTVLITGGISGIGLGLAEAFLKAGSRVIVCGRNREKLSSVKEKFPDIEIISCDVSSAAKRKKLAADVLRRFPALDVLINNAGIQRYIDLKKGYDELKSGEDEIAINLVAPVELTALFIGALLKKSSTAIINVSSGLGFMPMTATPVYNATKAAVHTYTLVLRQQLKDTGVRVYEIVPPMVDTDLNKAGRDAAHARYRGISVKEYIPTVTKALENDVETIFHGDSQKVMSEPRSKSETSLLNPSW